MYRYRTPNRYTQPYPRVTRSGPRLNTRERRWRLAWPGAISLMLANLMLLLTLLILGLEIGSLALDGTHKLSNTASTGAGILCSISFIITVVLMYLHVLVHDNSQLWATYTLVSHLITLVFICILISLDANAVTPYNSMPTGVPTKIQLLRGQLAGAVLMILFPVAFKGLYIYTALVSVVPTRVSPSNTPPRQNPYPTRLPKY